MTQVVAGTFALLSRDVGNDMASVSISPSTSLLGQVLLWEYLFRDMKGLKQNLTYI